MLMEIFVAVQSYVYLQHMPTELSRNLNETFVRRYDVQKEETQAIDYIQRRVSIRNSDPIVRNSLARVPIIYFSSLVIEDAFDVFHVCFYLPPPILNLSSLNAHAPMT